MLRIFLSPAHRRHFESLIFLGLLVGFVESVDNRVDASKLFCIVQSCLNVEEISGYHGLRVAKTRNQDVLSRLKIG